ncbi:DUF445 domain-containing protein [Chitinophaga sp. SYP-B3965]|uniref:DUF445 domain-containing protein n=1 Tax=Chitinophaga sp. SYP-B3965 TaxID=2663120 RepID=UPI001299EEF2|nr:DUF445 domain-containing protein [Chitinophaga sp. SYP-B3965]MRG43690.1 DUF445 domain-containing protein [Chitinophaga sp. SYP-B3965]
MIYLIPFLAAFTGWFVNRAALWLIFHPVKPVKLGLFTLQGIFPKQQQQLAEQLGKLVAEQFFSFEDIRRKLTDPAKISAIKPQVEEHLEHFLRKKLPEAMPMIAMFIGDSTILQIKTTLANELDILFPKLIDQYLVNAQKDFDLQSIVATKVAGLSSEQLEQGLYRQLGSGLAKIGWFSAAVGFIVGLLQLLLAIL